jgi:pimeloyl-ACP methyl ester carboxylesterase
MANWRRITGVTGLVVGAVAAGAGAVVAAERIAISRLRGSGGPDGSGAPGGPGRTGEPFGTLRGRELTVLAEDGIALHVEINGPDDAPVTVIFSHGYTLNQDCWHFQRRDLDNYRLVFWDQRDHGRSGRCEPVSATISQLGADLKAVIDAAAPGPGPVILVGHSMGGMTIMSLAEQHPGLFGTKVAGVVLISTAASGLNAGSPWMPGPVRPVLARVLPYVLDTAAGGRRAALVERGRRASPDLAFLSTRLIGFGDGQVSPDLVVFLEEMIAATPIDVVARFGHALLTLDQRDSLPTLGRVPVIVMVGEKDRLVAPQLGIKLAMEIPGARLVWVPGGGHALILERPELVNEAITSLAATVAAGGGLPRSA